jgi:hypothetical protein
MFTQTEMDALFSRIMDRMVEAQWLQSYTRTEGKGFRLHWTVDGAIRAALLRDLCTSHGLIDDDRAPASFDMLAQGLSLPSDVRFPGQIDERAARVWLESVAALRLDRSGDDLLVFVHVVMGWAPRV